MITSLNQTECKRKYCGILEVVRDECRLIPIQLLTPRQFVFDDLNLNDHFETDVDVQDIDDFLRDRVDGMVQRAKEMRNEQQSSHSQQHLSFITSYEAPVPGGAGGDNDDDEKVDIMNLPIIRLRVDHSNFPKLRAAAFGHHFLKSVANPEDILLFHKRSARGKASEKTENANQSNIGGAFFDLASGMEQTLSIEDIVTNNITVWCFH